MIDFFKKHKKVILRTIGISMIIVGFVVNFWVMPKKGLTQVEIATANVARMEASVAQRSGRSTKKSKFNKSPFLQEFKNVQKKRMQYFSILVMIFGVGFLGYSFTKRD